MEQQQPVGHIVIIVPVIPSAQLARVPSLTMLGHVSVLLFPFSSTTTILLSVKTVMLPSPVATPAQEAQSLNALIVKSNTTLALHIRLLPAFPVLLPAVHAPAFQSVQDAKHGPKHQDQTVFVQVLHQHISIQQEIHAWLVIWSFRAAQPVYTD